MNINTRIKIYIVVAVFLLATYFLNYKGKENELPEIGMVPEFEFVNSEQETITLNNLKVLHEMRSSKIIHIIYCHVEGDVGDAIVGGVSPTL